MANRFYIKRTDSGRLIDMKHYEGVTNIVYNQMYDIAVSEANTYGRVIPEEFMLSQLRVLKENGTLKLVRGCKGVIKVDL